MGIRTYYTPTYLLDDEFVQNYGPRGIGSFFFNLHQTYRGLTTALYTRPWPNLNERSTSAVRGSGLYTTFHHFV